MIKMKALKTFRGRDQEGRPKKGREFDVTSEARANDLIRAGLAARIGEKAEPGAPSNKVEAPLQNKSEDTPSRPNNTSRPLSLTGGQTGEATLPLSSEQGQAPQQSTSRRRRAEPASD